MTVKELYEKCDKCRLDTKWYIIDECGDLLGSKKGGTIFARLVQYYDCQIFHFTITSTNEVIVWLE